MNLGNKLLEVRNAAMLSQTQLAALLKSKGIYVKPYTLSRWENNVSKPDIEAFLALCEVCGVEDIKLTFSDAKRLLPLYNLPVSAGVGNYLDGSDYEMIEFDDSVPISANYALRVSGDSMIPQFVDGQIIFIREQPSLKDGEIGIFCLNNDAYLKKLGGGCLISLNSRYEPITIHEYDDFRVFGKVVGSC